MEPSTPSTGKTIPLLDLEALHQPIREEIDAACAEVLSAGSYILGPNVGRLEEELAGYCGVRHAVGVASGSDALHLGLRALDIGAGDEVITTAFTFGATAGSIMLTGARPVFVDIDPASFNIDHSAVEAAITQATKAILPVHLYGQSCAMDELNAIAREHGLAVIEDNCQALGAEFDGDRTGSLGDLAAVSFFPSKNLGCCGDGGMVLTDRADLADRIRSLRAHGTSRKYYSEELGLNSRLDELQAAILRVKLPHLDGWNDQRRDNAAAYDRLLADEERIISPAVNGGNRHIYHQYTVRVPGRDHVKDSLHRAGIATAVYYPVPLHRQPLFADLAPAGGLTQCEAASETVLSLPIGPELAASDIELVASELKAAVEGL